jgi:hypothetical protein
MLTSVFVYYICVKSNLINCVRESFAIDILLLVLKIYRLLNLWKKCVKLGLL